MIDLNDRQREAVTTPGDVLLLGPAGSGKTTALQRRLVHLLRQGVSAYNLLVLVAEYGHEQPFLSEVRAANLGPYAQLNITTYNSLAREMVSLFWPLVAREAGFAAPHRPPTFLEYDMAQLLMWRILQPLQAEGAFAGLRLQPQRVVSQLIDILNRAAFNGLSLEEAIARQARAWKHDGDQLKLLADAAEAAQRFRAYCLRGGLLDFSLTIEVFDRQLVGSPVFHRYFTERYRHVLVDNVEETTHAAQSFVVSLRAACESLAVAFDTEGGYRRFLSADPAGAWARLEGLGRRLEFDASYTSRPALRHLAGALERFLDARPAAPNSEAAPAVLAVVQRRYRREMLAALPAALEAVMAAHDVLPRDVAILAPYLDGALQYTLRSALRRAGIPYRLLRRRSSPREEPRVRAWLTWLALARPEWDRAPSPFEVAEALDLSIAGLDPARAALLARHAYSRDGAPQWLPADRLDPAIVDRVGPAEVALAESIRAWIFDGGAELALAAFLYQLFNDLLGQPAFQPDGQPDPTGAAICDWLVRTASRLVEAAPALGLSEPGDVGRAFIDGINQGLVTANPPDLGEPPDEDGVVLATVYGYLLSGLHSRVQVWLECGIMGWWQTPYQPLSNAFLLVASREEATWDAQDDIAVRNELLGSVIQGLASRCHDGVLLTLSDLDRRGQRQNGPLWRALQGVLRATPPLNTP